MAIIYPFRGYRYNPDRIGDLAKVVTQPYDKIPDSLRSEYYNRHPKNVVRIIKNSDYAEAAGFWDLWIKEGTLIREEIPCIYAYSQEFEFEGERMNRRGLICLVSLEDPDLVVKGHERVLDGPLADRLNLIRATEANEGLIFGLFSDTERTADQLLDKIASNPPNIDVTDDFGVQNRIWCIYSPEEIESIQRVLRENALYIADGHHRYPTSVVFHRECRERGWRAIGDESYDKRMMALFNMDSPGMRILATHRAIKNLDRIDITKLLEALSKNFKMTKVAGREEFDRAFLDSKSIGLVFSEPRSFYLLDVEDSAKGKPDFMPNVEGISRYLDVNLLHEGILAPLLGIGAEELASQKYVDYFRYRDELFSGIENGDYQMGFFLRPTSLEQVRQVSETGRKMPQKSTDFFPKLLTGLVMMKMDIGKNE